MNALEEPILAVFFLHQLLTSFMTGLCWMVQVVHYPLFKFIPMESFPTYEKKNAVTAYITVPVMIIELLTALYLVYLDVDFIFVLNLVLLGAIWLSTAFFQIPIHVKLMERADHLLIDRLILTNWIRTLGWTIRSILLFYFFFKIST